MPRLSEEQINRAIGMLMAGVAVSDVSQAFGCTRQTISKLTLCADWNSSQPSAVFGDDGHFQTL